MVAYVWDLIAVDSLFFSDLVYHGPDSQTYYDGQLQLYGYDKKGWTYLTKSDPNSNRYFGVAFKNTATGQIIVANRGSGSETDWGISLRDIFHQIVPAAFTDAKNFANSVVINNPGFTVTVTGHSLGGAEGEYQSAELGISGKVFAAPGVAWAAPGKTANIFDYTYQGEPIGRSGIPFPGENMVSLATDGPKQWQHVADSISIGDALASTGAVGIIIASELGSIALHPIDNYLENAGLLSSSIIFPQAPDPFVFDWSLIYPQAPQQPIPVFDWSDTGNPAIDPLLGAILAMSPIDPKSTLPVSIGGAATISHSFLWSVDPLNRAAQLTYTIMSGPMHGVVLGKGVAATSFTQADIDSGRVQYLENGDGASRDSFTFQLSDPAGNHTDTETFNIAVLDDPKPVVEGSGNLTVAAGARAPLVNTELDTVALGNTPDQIIYQVTAGPEHGALLIDGVAFPLFTQSDIDNGQMKYASNGDGAGNDSFAFTAWNSSAEWTTGTVNVAIQPASATQLAGAGGSDGNSWQGSVPAGYQIAGVGDFHGNGSSDILLRNPVSGDVAELRSDQGMNFSDIGWAGAGWEVPGTADLNGDGTTDIVFAFPGSGAVGAWVMNDGHPTWALLASASN